jgi:gliding motility-associated-like protein
MKSLLGVFLCVLVSSPVFAQIQACPANSNFAMGVLTHWSAYTGNNTRRGTNTSGNGGLQGLVTNYDTTNSFPGGTIGTNAITEYQLPSPNGIQVITTSGTDPFGFFQTIPNINGYQYDASVKLGSTTISTGPQGSEGGYVRGISYNIYVPTSTINQPYTMTYAYAMVLENGTHDSDQQPLFQATLNTSAGIVTCASPQYYLPTFNNTTNQGTGATLDSAAAKANGFRISSTPSPNPNPNSPNGGHLLDVWWKSWTEVTFDLSPYRGQTVTLTFEADNCVPGGHFAYAYVALRNICAGLLITGDTLACTNSDLTYSIPSLNGATYNWTIPAGWTLNSTDTSYSIQTTIGQNGGMITAHEVNSCADLRATLNVVTVPPTIPGNVSGGTEICAGTPSSSVLTLTGQTGSVLNWLATTKGVTTPIADTFPTYTAVNLGDSTTFAAVVRNGQSCSIDTSGTVTVPVDPMTVPGTIDPANIEVCTGQDKGATLTLTGAVGLPTNWQYSLDNGTNWTNTTPADNTLTYGIDNITANTEYRAVVQSGVCPADTSTISEATILPGIFPQATIDPADTTICYGSSIPLNANILTGTSYSWTNAKTLANPSPGNISATPYTLTDTASPKSSTGYILTILNMGCPNPLLDTFQINVDPPITVFAGHDTAVVVGQPLQLNATSSDPGDAFTWSPVSYLSNPNIFNPIALFTAGLDSIRYTATATNDIGCTGSASIRIEVFTTQPDIFVPSAFTPTVNVNNIFKPILVGITSLQFFRVYNRYGQLVYSTSSTEAGWDGTLNGKIQEPSAYVWMVQGTSYTGKSIFKKGTVVLIR